MEEAEVDNKAAGAFLFLPEAPSEDSSPAFFNYEHRMFFDKRGGKINCSELYEGALAFSLLLIVLLLSFAAPVSASPDNLASHKPIYIYGNDNFTENNGVVGGSGTENSPFIIEDWLISAENRNGITIVNTSAYFIVRNCLVENGGVSYDGIYFDNIANGRIENCTIENNQNGVYFEESSHNTVFNNRTRKNNWDGIQLWDSSMNKIVGNDISNSGQEGLDLRTSNKNRVCFNNFLGNENQAYDGGMNYWDNGYPSGGNYWSDQTGVDENRGENQDIPGIDGIVDAPYDVSGDNNQDRYPLIEPWSPGKLRRHSPILISEDNEFTPANGVASGNGTENDPYVIKNWAIDASNTHGIWIRHTDNYLIIRNCLVENGGMDSHGIYLKDLEHGSVENCLSRGNLYGVYLYRSTKSTISYSTCFRNNTHGIYLAYSSNNTLNSNTSENNSWYGVALYPSSSKNVLYNNSCLKNEEGIRIQDSSDNNLIYHNSFLNNENQAYDDGSNYWDNGYPSGGNYWSDYAGVDESHGENQDIPGDDGFGDTSYQIPGDNNEDHYPLMRTWSPRPSVEVSISPSEDNAPPGYTLSYEVTVTNTGNISDSYDLTVTENAAPSWDPILDKGLFENIIPGENCTTVLEVTVPDNADFGIEDNIVVTATSQENAQVTDNASCTALSAALVRGVKVTVSPGLKGGYLGSTLEYSVTVKNEGNVPDNYELNASDDVDPSWNPSFADNLMENVASGEEKTAMLSVKIPDNDNLIGTTDNISIAVTSLENTSVSDSEICHAEAVEPPVGGVFHPADRKSLQSEGSLN